MNNSYRSFIANVQVGDRVSVYNHATGQTHTTKVTQITTKHMKTQRSGSREVSVFTSRGSGTGATVGNTIMPYVQPKLVKANPKKKHTPAKVIAFPTPRDLHAAIAA